MSGEVARLVGRVLGVLWTYIVLMYALVIATLDHDYDKASFWMLAAIAGLLMEMGTESRSNPAGPPEGRERP